MLWLYRNVLSEAIQRAIKSWLAALSLVAYAVILIVTSVLASRLGIIGSLVLGLVMAACWSSYLELISQAVGGPRFHLTWDDFKGTFLARFGDVISVMFVFWILSLVTQPLMSGPQGPALAAILGFAMAFFFNAVPELLYQGNSRSVFLLIDSAKFVLNHPVVWFLPNLILATLALWAGGGLAVRHPAELLVAFGTIFSSPSGIASLFLGLPMWVWPIALFVLHFAMVFRGLLFKELSSGRGSARWREYKSRSRS